METINSPQFNFIYQDNGANKISHSKIIDFLESNGFHHVVLGTQTRLVRSVNNIIRPVSVMEIIEFMRSTLEESGLREIYDIFAKNPGSYVGVAKLMLLEKKEVINDRDARDSSVFYFQNCLCEVTIDKIEIKSYKELRLPIWENRILKKDYTNPKNDDPGQFHLFCQRITGGVNERFETLRCLLGFLLHRNKERGDSKAVILYDEKMGVEGKANGRTGKSLLGEAISICREVEPFDGKSLKFDSNFRNQRITHTTDILFYDDLQKNTSFDKFYALLTKGVEVEKKGKDSYFIDQLEAPKLLMTSNHYVYGDGGDSDLSRRFEFEISNYFSNKFRPEDEFGNRFFDTIWHIEEWNKFFAFMFGCVQMYLQKGLVEAIPLNLPSNKVADITCPEFLEFAKTYFVENQWLNKRQLFSDFKELFPDYTEMSPHMFTKWLVHYGRQKQLVYQYDNSGGVTSIRFVAKSEDDE